MPDRGAADEETLRVVDGWHAALNAGDTERLVALSHPDVEIIGPRGAVRLVLHAFCNHR